MYLKSARIRHYKSLDDLELRFERGVTLIVGPNASGKSNIIDALRFVHDAVTDGLEHAVSTRDGITRIRQYSKSKPYKVSLSLCFDPQDEDKEADELDYSFSLASKEGGNYIVDSEGGFIGNLSARHTRAKSDEPATPQPIRLKRDPGGRYSIVPLWEGSQVAATDQLAMAMNGPAGAVAVFDSNSIPAFVSDWNYYALYPNTLRGLSPPERDGRLNESGKNYASVIKQLKRTKAGKEALSRIYETMQEIVPAFREVSVSTVGGFLVPKFRFSIDGQSVDYDAIQLSDGTLRVFGLLLALYQVPAPRLLLIEEPEQNVQPGVLAVLADAFREASTRTQIIVTTHSPNFVDHFSPEEVRVTSSRRGATVIAPIKASQKRAVQKHLLSLSEFMLAEGLVPEGVE
ncbi:AAA family ATPase [Pelomonas sp. Root1444]|uniref:AAA family ATPase n=1 Tax=Pelomonas sp. Root1444 TaxID=1736464 RepID=UPI0007036ECA|nr:AAA family ATPase [Pelomonas sp. Root1444]KQY88847.1 hypothetical protein ASD35_15060 [Pelomonas sp. Root1444]